MYLHPERGHTYPVGPTDTQQRAKGPLDQYLQPAAPRPFPDTPGLCGSTLPCSEVASGSSGHNCLRNFYVNPIHQASVKTFPQSKPDLCQREEPQSVSLLWLSIPFPNLFGLWQSLGTWTCPFPEFSLTGHFPVPDLEGKLSQILSVYTLHFQPGVPNLVLGFFWLFPQSYASVSQYWRLDSVFLGNNVYWSSWYSKGILA